MKTRYRPLLLLLLAILVASAVSTVLAFQDQVPLSGLGTEQEADQSSSSDYTLDWWTVDGGGGRSSGGDYTLSGTIGQSDAGLLTNGDYVLNGGFWYDEVACQPPASVTTMIASNTVLLTWDSGTYHIYRAINDPYFVTTTLYASDVASGWPDPISTVNDTTQHAFYVVGNSITCGQRVGEFEYTLTPGS